MLVSSPAATVQAAGGTGLAECEFGRTSLAFVDVDDRAVVSDGGGFPGFPTDAFTVSLWMRGDDVRQGSIFSYATPQYQNELLVFDPHRLAMHVGNAPIVT